MDNLAYTLGEIYKEVSEQALGQGALSREEWNELVESVLDDRRKRFEMDEDADFVQTRESLQAMYDDFSGEVGVM